MPDDCASRADIIRSRWRYIGPIGDLSISFQIGRHLVEGKNLRCSGCLFRCEANRDVSSWSEPVTGQALTDRFRDLAINGNAARNRDNRQAMLACNAVEMRCRNLALNRTVETHENKRWWFAGIWFSAACCSREDRYQEKHQASNACEGMEIRRWAVVDVFRVDYAAVAMLAFDEARQGAVENARATEKKGNRISHA